jgi:hypothetical protein
MALSFAVIGLAFMMLTKKCKLNALAYIIIGFSAYATWEIFAISTVLMMMSEIASWNGA